MNQYHTANQLKETKAVLSLFPKPVDSLALLMLTKWIQTYPYKTPQSHNTNILYKD